MTRTFRSVWASLIWLFVILIPIQFHGAGHGAMEGANAANNATPGKGFVVMTDAWAWHFLVGNLLALVSILILITALVGQPPRPLLGLTTAVFVDMVIQYVLPFFNDSASGRPIAALHPVNALILTSLAIMLAIRSRPYVPIARFRSDPGKPILTESGASTR
jgi:hypothetical protein